MALVGMVENTGCVFVACGLPSILKFSQVFVIWECTDLLCPEQGMAPGTVHRNARAPQPGELLVLVVSKSKRNISAHTAKMLYGWR